MSRCRIAVSAWTTAMVLSACQTEAQVAPQPPAPPPAPAPLPPPPTPIVISDRIEFDTASPLLREQDRATLDRITVVLKDNPHVRLVELQAHTDESGDEEKNLHLSELRGEAVRAYLISQGIEASRLRVKLFGKTVPIAPNDTAEGRARNRRVELRVIQQ